MDRRERAASKRLEQRSNWNRWGRGDERGALNLLTPDVVLGGIRCARRGLVYPLGDEIGAPRSPIVSGRTPALHFMSLDGGDWAAGIVRDDRLQVADDCIMVSPHGSTTHLDALCHVWTAGQMYNGFNGNLVRSYGATKLGIENVGSIITRGILLDIARLRGVEVLAAEDIISDRDITECLAAEGVGELRRGDAVLIRTGWPLIYSRDPNAYSGRQPGIGLSAGLLLADADVVLVGADNSAVNPVSGGSPGKRSTEDAELAAFDLHVAFLRNLGVYLLEMLDLEALAADRVYEFLFCVAPLLIRGGTGSPVNPLAIA